MSIGHRHARVGGSTRSATSMIQDIGHATPGKQTLVEAVPAGPAGAIQRKLQSETAAPAAGRGPLAGDRAQPAAPSTTGKPLPTAARAKMERAMGADFSAVRIHEGRHVSALQALGYTQGTDIHFAPGQYDPESRQGQELLGHELAHVVQQAQGRVQAPVQAKGVAINSDSALEREADELGARAAAGHVAEHGSSATISTSGAPGAPVQRQLVGEPGVDGFFWDNRDTIHPPPLTFRHENGNTFTEMYSDATITYLPGPDQFQTATGRYLDPESHQYFDYVPSSQSYLDAQGVFFRYLGGHYVRANETTQDANSIEKTSREEGGIWTVGSVFVDGVFQQRTQLSRSGEQTHHDNPYSTQHVSRHVDHKDEIKRSRSDAEVDTLLELDRIMKQLIDSWTQSPATVRVVVTGTFGPCDECKLRINAFVERVQRLVNQVNKKTTVLAPFTLQVESRYLNPTMPSREDGERKTTYGYNNDQQILIGPLVGYEKISMIQIQ